MIVRRLASIENFGSMNVLCTDKTGTLTARNRPAQQARQISMDSPATSSCSYAYLNASFESGFSNPIDEAIREQGLGGP